MRPTISAIILAGGQGTRMNYQNKGLMNFQSQPLVQHVISRLTPQVDDIVISANQDLKDYQQYNFPVVRDKSESVGPLSGILSASEFTKHSTVLVVPCDMPFLPLNLVEVLSPALDGNAVSISSNGQRQPLVCLLDALVISTIDDFLKSGQRSVDRWLQSINGKILPWDNDPEAFRNLNKTTDLISEQRLEN